MKETLIFILGMNFGAFILLALQASLVCIFLYTDQPKQALHKLKGKAEDLRREIRGKAVMIAPEQPLADKLRNMNHEV